MKIFTFIIAILVSGVANSAAKVGPTTMEVEFSGFIGEKGALKPVPYQLTASFKDKASVWPSNKQQLNSLSASVNGVAMQLSSALYSKLSGVSITDIRLFYIQRWSEESSVEISIPYGQHEPCKNHDDGSVHYLQGTRILVFSTLGIYRDTKEMHACVQ
jgi:hypothetical protein